MFHKEGLQPAILSKKRLIQIFSCEFGEVLRTAFFAEYLRMTASTFFYVLALPTTVFSNVSDAKTLV